MQPAQLGLLRRQRVKTPDRAIAWCARSITARRSPRKKFEPPKFEEWLKKQIARAPRGSPTHRPPLFPSAASVVVCYEAGCFGCEPARRLQALGAEVLVIAPQDWDEQGRGGGGDSNLSRKRQSGVERAQFTQRKCENIL